MSIEGVLVRVACDGEGCSNTGTAIGKVNARLQGGVEIELEATKLPPDWGFAAPVWGYGHFCPKCLPEAQHDEAERLRRQHEAATSKSVGRWNRRPR